jgi:mannan endo-1,4-beta-mannosidase
MRSNLNGNSSIALLTGGGQWVSESVQSAYLSCNALDIIGIHAYSPGDMTTSNLQPYVSKATTAGKKLLLEEWGACYFDTTNNDCPAGGVLSASTRNSNINTWGKAILEAGIPLMYWQILPNKDPHQSYDYEVAINDDPSWSTLQALLKSAATYSSPFDYSKWLLQ